jgi:ribosomal protein S18 acetylase RimI-like enzyme
MVNKQEGERGMSFSRRQYKIKDDGVITIRPAGPGDADALIGYLSALTRNDLRRRFRSGAVPGRDALEVVLGGDVVWLVAVSRRGKVVGEATRTDCWHDETADLQGLLADIELSVAPAWRRRRVATALIDALAIDARDNGARHLRARVADTNAAAISLLNRTWVYQRWSQDSAISTYFRTL